MKRDLSKSPTVAFDPSSPSHRWHLWVRFYSSRSGDTLYIYWRKIFALLGILAVSGWFTLCLAAWSWVRYNRGFTQARYVDLCLPWRWTQYRHTLGNRYFIQAQAESAKNELVSALHDFSAALALEPHSLEVRRDYAACQLRLGLRAPALATLTSDVDAAYAATDEAYLRLYFTAVFDLQEDEQAVLAGQKFLPPNPTDHRIDQFVAFQTATALTYLRRFSEARALIARWNLFSRPEGVILDAQCAGGIGGRDSAYAELEQGLKRFSGPALDPLYVALENIARQAKRLDIVERYAFLREFNDPAHPAPHLDIISADVALGDTSAALKEATSYCTTFGADGTALAMLAEYAVQLAQPAIARLAQKTATSHHSPLLGFNVAAAETDLAAERYRETLADLPAISALAPAENHTVSAILAGLKSAALFGTGDDSAELSTTYFLPLIRSLRPADALVIAQAYEASHHPDKARQVLEALRPLYPDNPALLTELVRATAEQPDREALLGILSQFLKERAPDPEVLRLLPPLLTHPDDAPLAKEVAEALQRAS